MIYILLIYVLHNFGMYGMVVSRAKNSFDSESSIFRIYALYTTLFVFAGTLPLFWVYYFLEDLYSSKNEKKVENLKVRHHKNISKEVKEVTSKINAILDSKEFLSVIELAKSIGGHFKFVAFVKNYDLHIDVLDDKGGNVSFVRISQNELHGNVKNILLWSLHDAYCDKADLEGRYDIEAKHPFGEEESKLLAAAKVLDLRIAELRKKLRAANETQKLDALLYQERRLKSFRTYSREKLSPRVELFRSEEPEPKKETLEAIETIREQLMK